MFLRSLTCDFGSVNKSLPEKVAKLLKITIYYNFFDPYFYSK